MDFGYFGDLSQASWTFGTRLWRQRGRVHPERLGRVEAGVGPRRIQVGFRS